MGNRSGSLGLHQGARHSTNRHRCVKSDDVCIVMLVTQERRGAIGLQRKIAVCPYEAELPITRKKLRQHARGRSSGQLHSAKLPTDSELRKLRDTPKYSACQRSAATQTTSQAYPIIVLASFSSPLHSSLYTSFIRDEAPFCLGQAL